MSAAQSFGSPIAFSEIEAAARLGSWSEFDVALIVEARQALAAIQREYLKFKKDQDGGEADGEEQQ